MKKNHHIANVLLDFTKNNKFWVSLLIFAGVFWAITFPVIPYSLGLIVDRIKNLADPTKLMLGLIIGPIIAFIGVDFLRTVNYYLIYTAFSICLPRAKANIVMKMSKYLGSQSYGYFEDKYSGYLTNKITNTITSIGPVVQIFFSILFPRTLVIIIVGIMLATVNPLFMITSWAWAAAIILYTYQTSKKGRRLSHEFADASSVINGGIVDFVSNIRNVIGESTLPQEMHIIKPVVDNMVKKDYSMQRYLAKVRFVQGSMTALFIAVTMLGLIYGYQQKWVSIGDFVFVFTILFGLLPMVHNLGATILDFYKSIGRLQQGLSLLDDPCEVTDKADAAHYLIKQGDIKLENICFQYNAKNKLFERITLHIAHGEKIGLVGQSGGGKSSLIKLLMRLYDIQSGSIKIDDREISDYTLSSLRHQIALVPQDLTLFHRSIYDNICYGCGEVTEQQVMKAAKQSHCHAFIMELPEKYDTQVGERGVKLSGGQRQRVAIARAMLKKAPILLLDEATSALDSETEHYIQEALNRLMEGRTAVVIAHRLSTLHAMDKIVVLENGHILEQGTQKELLAKKGKFYKMWQLQSNGLIGDI